METRPRVSRRIQVRLPAPPRRRISGRPGVASGPPVLRGDDGPHPARPALPRARRLPGPLLGARPGLARTGVTPAAKPMRRPRPHVRTLRAMHDTPVPGRRPAPRPPPNGPIPHPLERVLPRGQARQPVRIRYPDKETGVLISSAARLLTPPPLPLHKDGPFSARAIKAGRAGPPPQPPPGERIAAAAPGEDTGRVAVAAAAPVGVTAGRDRAPRAPRAPSSAPEEDAATRLLSGSVASLAAPRPAPHPTRPAPAAAVRPRSPRTGTFSRSTAP